MNCFAEGKNIVTLMTVWMRGAPLNVTPRYQMMQQVSHTKKITLEAEEIFLPYIIYVCKTSAVLRSGCLHCWYASRALDGEELGRANVHLSGKCDERRGLPLLCRPGPKIFCTRHAFALVRGEQHICGCYESPRGRSRRRSRLWPRRVWWVLLIPAHLLHGYRAFALRFYVCLGYYERVLDAGWNGVGSVCSHWCDHSRDHAPLLDGGGPRGEEREIEIARPRSVLCFAVCCPVAFIYYIYILRLRSTLS